MCDYQGSPSCELTKDKNSLVVALRLVIKTKLDPDAVKTALAIVEHVSPTPHTCPLCERPGVVRNNAVHVHFASVTHDKPCPASYQNVLGGVLWTGRTR
jgi:hypothetical protein